MSAESHDHKYKGTGRDRRPGLGRLRRAAEGSKGRLRGWVRHAEDDDFLERHATLSERSTHLGESLLARFNRVARDSSSAPAAALSGAICGFAGKSIHVRPDQGQADTVCEVRQALMKRLPGARNPLAVGDRVRFTLATDGTGTIEAVEPRRSVLARADSHNRALLHLLAVNVDVLVVVAALTQPDLKPGFLDRYLLIAAANGIEPLIALNKCDLADPEPIARMYRDAGFEVYATTADRADDPGVTNLRTDLIGTTAVFAGQSGVGKSSLVNALFPGLGALVGTVADTGLGRQTTTAARSYATGNGGSVIDTPGIRECGITGLTTIDVALLYPDIARFHHLCRFNDCTHRHEPECAVLAAVARGEIAKTRYGSYRSILDEDLTLSPP